MSSSPDTCNLQRRAFLAGMAALLLLPCLPGCRSQSPLTIAAHLRPGYELLFLARREGWLPAGITLLETAAATDSMKALENGTAHAAALTLDEVLQARSKGIPLTAVLVFDISAGADLVMARPDIRSLANLANRRIGVEDTALGAYVLHLVLHQPCQYKPCSLWPEPVLWSSAAGRAYPQSGDNRIHNPGQTGFSMATGGL